MGSIGLLLIPSCFDENINRNSIEINKSSTKYCEKYYKTASFCPKIAFFNGIVDLVDRSERAHV